ncbi:MAG: hypothetical protein RJA13_870 [Bacteroidota bacterium]
MDVCDFFLVVLLMVFPVYEETTYYLMRIENFKFMYFAMFLINFSFPMLILMSRDAKRNAGILSFVGLIILTGHWFDVYIMIAAGSMGAGAKLGILELGMAVLFVGFFIRVILVNLTKSPLRVILVNLTKSPLTPVNHPFLDESIHHEI